MVDTCIFDYVNIYFLSLMSQYTNKGDINNEDGKMGEKLIALFERRFMKKIANSDSLSEFLFFFYNCVQMVM